MIQKTSFPKNICYILIFLLTFQFIYGQNLPEITALELGKPLEREIGGGQKHEFQISAAAGQYTKLTVEQREIDVVVRLVDADGKTVIESDSEPRNKGAETIELASEIGGNLRLTVEPKQKSARAGSYEIRLIEQRKATAKEIVLDEGRKLLTAANNLWWAGKYPEALPLAERALAIRERELSAEHADVGQAVFVLGNIVGDMGDLAKCETLYARAVEIWEKSLGKEHPLIGKILINWGVVYYIKGDYVKAETFYARALEIWDKTLEPNHLLLAAVLNNLAGISRIKGDIAKAAALFQRALTIRENALGTEHQDVATSLNNIANLYDDIAIAEPLYLRSLAIREKVFGPEHQDVAQTLYNLARIYSSAGDYQKAKPMCERALTIFEKTLGAEHAFVSYPINLLAVIYKNTGDYNKSESLYLRAIALKEKTQGAFHPELGGTYANLANLYALRGEIEKSIAAQTRANEILEYNTALNLSVGSEREKLEYLKTLREIEYQTLTLNFKTAPNSSAATNLAVTSVLQRKGRVLDAVSESFGTLRRRFDKQDQSLLDSLNEATSRLVGFVSEGRQNMSADEYRQKIKTLEQQRESVESQISRRSAGFYEASKSITLNAVQTAIPEKAALLEFAVYRPISYKSFEFAANRPLEANSIENARYVVFVINSKGEVRSKELGSAPEIDRTINEFRQALRDPKRKDLKQIARQTDEKIMQPIRALLGDAEQLLVSPDGALNLIPFEALIDEKGRYLIENYSFAYLTGGRDLLRMQTARTSKNKSLIIANPLFGTPTNNTAANEKTNGRSNKRPSITATGNLTETYFAPLGGTIQEARSIQNLFPDWAFLTGAAATETVLKQIDAPHILHIATHGFFLENSTTEGNNVKIENPLLRSGLALAGANRRSSENGDDGILTALEASGLNLWGTKLVVLSACDTGLGEVKNGEGVYGLRRAFTLAGTETLMMSLWSVSDYATRELMTNYYKNLKSGMGRGASLRQVQLEMLNRKERQHPFYWAAFIQSGEWANLNGKR